MVKVDVVRVKTVIVSISESEKKMRYLYESIYELIGQMNENNGLYRFSAALDEQLEELKAQLYCLKQFEDCLEQMVSMYDACEERNAVYVEETQIVGNIANKEFNLESIPEWIFEMLM